MDKMFLEWCAIMEAENGKKRKPYNVRLNPEDAKYGLPDKEWLKTNTEQGFTQTSMDAYDAAWQNTMGEITKSLPKEMQEAIKALRKKEKVEKQSNIPGATAVIKYHPKLVRLRKDAACSRCGGSGKRDDYDGWIHHGSLGKVCYRCHGSGIKTSMEPVFFRRRAIDYIKQFIFERNYDKLQEWANRVINSTEETQPYRPVLIDAANLIKERRYNEIYKLPH